MPLPGMQSPTIESENQQSGPFGLELTRTGEFTQPQKEFVRLLSTRIDEQLDADFRPLDEMGKMGILRNLIEKSRAGELTMEETLVLNRVENLYLESGLAYEAGAFDDEKLFEIYELLRGLENEPSQG